MLAEADAAGTNDESDRPLKKRRTTSSKKAQEETSSSPAQIASARPSPSVKNAAVPESHKAPASSPQTVEDSSESDVSEFEFEDVDLDGTSAEPADGIEDLSISVQPESSSKRSAQSRRKPASVAEKAQRLLVHKMHFLCLLGHCMYVNGRCNNPVAQKHLRKLLSAKTISYLNPKTSESQFQRDRSFMDGLQQVVDTFNAEYRSGGAGLIRPQWIVEGESPRQFDCVPMDRSDFITAAQNLEGTQDLGNQLFCSMLRSAGVDARIVCSLQVLPYASGAKPPTPKKLVKEVIFAIASNEVPSKKASTTTDTAIAGSSTVSKVPSARRRLGQPTFASAEASKPAPTPKKKTRPAPKLSYPVLWVEAFNEAQQKWIPVDPVVTHTINKPAKIEPPSSYEYNQLLYAIAFEGDGSARDVTRRYAKAYNAKTRRHRVEASAEGAKWFKKVMRFFRRRAETLDRDQVEDAELAQKEAKEGMPGNVLDFKNHPYYALERHLKRHEVIHPRREVGKVNAGTAAKPRMEAVFRRKDVLICRSADKWYRIGREVKEGEQPLKHVPARARGQRSVEDDDDGEAAPTTGLYAPYQTQLYVPPPVQKGRIPKNVYGNLDVYAPTMVPAGGVHIRHVLAQRAAKLLRVDYADAVTGFKFQGRHGTAIMEGVVVAQQFEQALRAVIEGVEEEQLEDESKARSLLALKVWKRFLTGLKIQERVEGYGDGAKGKQVAQEDEEMPDAGFYAGPLVDDERPMITAGKFTIEELLAPPPKPAPTRKKRVVDESDEEFARVSDDEDEHLAGGFSPDARMDDAEMAGGFVPAGHNEPGGFLPEDDGGGGGFLPENHDPCDGGRFLPEQRNDQSGGFLPDAGEKDVGGGFLPENEEGQEGGFLPDEPHDDAGGLMPQQVTITEQGPVDDAPFGDHEAASQDAEPRTAATAPHNDLESARNDKVDTEMVDNDAATHDAGQDVEDQADEEAEKGSLPSHDSEDEDAEPDWLDSD